MLFKTILLSLAALQVQAAASNLDTRAVVNHDAIRPVGERVQAYAAVDEAGNTSGGLKPAGNTGAGCSDASRGQTYVRATMYNNQLAIMYAWYMPKDQTIPGIKGGGHRHDWENIVIFVNPSNGALISGAASGHGKYTKTRNPRRQGDRPKVEYFTRLPTNHELQFTNTLGRDLPMLDWNVMTPAMQRSLNTVNFGSANVPFKDGSFMGNIQKAFT